MDDTTTKAVEAVETGDTLVMPDGEFHVLDVAPLGEYMELTVQRVGLGTYFTRKRYVRHGSTVWTGVRR